MTVPTVLVRIDWDCAPGAVPVFTGPYCTVDPIAKGMQITRGRSVDLGGDSPGQLTFSLKNDNYAYSPDRQWHDNASFETSTDGWSTAAIASLTAAATSITKVADAPTGAGSACGEAVLTATQYSGVTYAIPYRFRSGVTYGFSVALKSTAGNLNVRAGLASSGTPADIGTTSVNVTTSWVTYSGTWTPSADRTDAVFFVRTVTAATGTVRIDACQVNPGSAANTYLEAPSKADLVPGKPVHVRGTYGGSDYGLFYGFIDRITPNPIARTVEVIATDPMGRMGTIDGIVPANTYVSRTPRDFRVALLEEYERGSQNLLATNPSFETDLTGWTATGAGSATRITTDAAPGGGSASMQLVGPVTSFSWLARGLVPMWFSGQVYQFSVYAKAVSGTGAVTLTGYVGSGITTVSRTFTPTATWARYTLSIPMAATNGSSVVGVYPGRVEIAVPSGTTVKIDAVAFTRGQPVYPWSATGTGRWPNWVGNGAFDGPSLTGWIDGWSNRCTNGNFESNTTGWLAGSGSIAQSTSYPVVGTYSMSISSSGNAYYAFSGTFKAGQAYWISGYAHAGGVGYSLTMQIKSNGTPADTASESHTTDGSGTIWGFGFTWTPSADRTDVRLVLSAGASVSYWDAIMVCPMDSALVAGPTTYVNAGPNAGGLVPPTSKAASTTSKYGTGALAVVTPATAGAGVMWDFGITRPAFTSGQAYTLSMWLRSSGAATPVKIGLSSAIGVGDALISNPIAVTGAMDEATATATIGTAYSQVTVTWTPSADRLTNDSVNAVTISQITAWVCQTDATARTIYIDGVRVIPGASADDFEPAQWNLTGGTEVTDAWTTAANSTGSVLAGLEMVNTAAFSRHWIVPAAAAPWYTYTTAARDARPAIAETFATDTANISGLQADIAAAVNTVALGYYSGTWYAGDETGVAANGPVVGSAVSLQWPNVTIAADIGAEILARSAHGHLRPTLQAANRFPSCLQRQPNDLVAVVIDRWLVHYFVASIERITLTISEGGAHWDWQAVLDEWPYAV